MSKEKFISIADYATLCKVSVVAIRKRRDTGLLRIVKKNGMQVIDVNKFPPIADMGAGRPKNSVRLAHLGEI